MVENQQHTLGLAALMHPKIHADPYLYYHRLRETDPVLRDEELRMWVLTQYTDVASLLRDPRFVADRIEPAMEGLEEAGLTPLRPLYHFLGDMMLFSDPPKHTRLRRLVNKAFTPRVIEAMRSQIQEQVDQLLDAVWSSGRMDVIRDLAYPLPTTVIAQMLGVPPQDRDRFKAWSDDLAVFLGQFQPSEEQMAQTLRSIQEISDYFRDTVADLRRTPRDNLLSALARAEDEGDVLNEQELLANAMLLLAAGHETTTNLIANGLLALLQHPDQLRLLQDDPTL
ncbi:MAG TPA: cytochrome P450, partial [Dehalococcoidia bacterium]|nr:cytochrome P450 [Dehalococcoidia bacterium]